MKFIFIFLIYFFIIESRSFADEIDDFDKLCKSYVNEAIKNINKIDQKENDEKLKNISQREKELLQKENDISFLITQKNQLLDKADSKLVDLFSKMKPDVAAEQLQLTDIEIVTSILNKMNIQSASKIIAQMDKKFASLLVKQLSLR
jgi:flagellar motility protein MotE (MotC chaperone)